MIIFKPHLVISHMEMVSSKSFWRFILLLKISNKDDDLNGCLVLLWGPSHKNINKIFEFELKKSKLQPFLKAKCND